MTQTVPTFPEQTNLSVLDHGHVQLIDYMGNDLSVVDAARVSFNKKSVYGTMEDHTPRPGKEEPYESYLLDRDVK